MGDFQKSETGPSRPSWELFWSKWPSQVGQLGSFIRPKLANLGRPLGGLPKLPNLGNFFVPTFLSAMGGGFVGT